MTQINISSIETHHKIVQFLQDEFSKLKSEHEIEFKKRSFRQKNITKKLGKLSLKIDSILKVNHLNPEALEELLLLQQEIKNYSQKKFFW